MYIFIGGAGINVMRGLLLFLAFSELIVMTDEHFNLCIEYKSAEVYTFGNELEYGGR